ncbi:peptidase E [Georgenia faecalis]|uniref:Type 1 glutamine amidotransferase-like domain-containing protein n=1 Tax=Georgenia faecalis TaxID=2483799 RepID=A0ABV9D9E3_9MICO|nr:peptidase E [Georgenia faecalis]
MVSHIVAAGAGKAIMDNPQDPTHDFILGLTGRQRPRVLFVGTAYGDHPDYALSFFETYDAERAYARRLKFFMPDVDNLREYVRSFDVIHVGGGNTGAMLGAWRFHGLDVILREMWEDETTSYVFAGGSAGALCWFENGTTDSYGPTVRLLLDGLGFLEGSVCPHYDADPQRRPVYLDAVATGRLPDGYAIGNLDSLHFHGTQLVEVVSSAKTPCAFRVERKGQSAVERELEVRRL